MIISRREWDGYSADAKFDFLFRYMLQTDRATAHLANVNDKLQEQVAELQRQPRPGQAAG